MQPGMFLPRIYFENRVRIIKLESKKFINMKRIMKVLAALLLLAMVAVACNHYVCPAYTNDTTKEQNSADRS
jgi:hypothetical protein